MGRGYEILKPIASDIGSEYIADSEGEFEFWNIENSGSSETNFIWEENSRITNDDPMGDSFFNNHKYTSYACIKELCEILNNPIIKMNRDNVEPTFYGPSIIYDNYGYIFITNIKLITEISIPYKLIIN